MKGRFVLRAISWGLFLVLSPTGFAATPVTVTITQKGPIESLSASGEVTGVSEAAVGDPYTLVNVQGSRLTLQDAQGGLHRIDLGQTDYVPPVVSAPSAPAPAAAPPATASGSSTPSSGSTSAASSSAPAALDIPAREDKVKAVNAAFGEPLFGWKNFWNESALLVAGRLRLRVEDRTKWESAYRRYFYNDTYTNYAPAPILGGKAYCLALYADANDAPTSVLIAFTNDGDYEGVVLLTDKIFRLQHADGEASAHAGSSPIFRPNWPRWKSRSKAHARPRRRR
jgi:hypothetical protein